MRKDLCPVCVKIKYNATNSIYINDSYEECNNEYMKMLSEYCHDCYKIEEKKTKKELINKLSPKKLRNIQIETLKSLLNNLTLKEIQEISNS